MRVMVVVAHPDDETLGCGGTIARHARANDDVLVVTFTDGVGSRLIDAALDEHDRQADDRRRSFARALAKLGVSPDVEELVADDPADAATTSSGGGWVHLSGAFEDQKLDAYPSLLVARAVRERLVAFRPDVVYTHWPHDLNRDHRVVAEAVMVATRPTDALSPGAVYAFETVSSTEHGFNALPVFTPTRYQLLSAEDIDAKADALRCYAHEHHEPPHPRSVRGVMALAQLRGSSVNQRYAEAFAVLREVAW